MEHVATTPRSVGTTTAQIANALKIKLPFKATHAKSQHLTMTTFVTMETTTKVVTGTVGPVVTTPTKIGTITARLVTARTRILLLLVGSQNMPTTITATIQTTTKTATGTVGPAATTKPLRAGISGAK